MAALTKLTTNINLEMSGDTKRYLVSAKQGDKATRFIVAKLLNNGEPYTIPTGSRAVINIARHRITTLHKSRLRVRQIAHPVSLQS